MAQRGPLAIDAIHVINLDRRPERMRRFVNRVRHEQEWQVPIVRHAAVDTSAWSTAPTGQASQMSFAAYVDPTQLGIIARGFREAESELSAGAVGCTLSHMALWTYLAAHSAMEYLTIFEDDAVWSLESHISLETLVDTLQERIPNDWDILSLGAQHLEVAQNHGYYSELKRYWATHAYILHRDAVPKLLRNMLPIRVQLDAAISEKTHTEGLHVVSPNRVIYWQHASETDVQVPLHLPDGSVRDVDGNTTDPHGVVRDVHGRVVGQR